MKISFICDQYNFNFYSMQKSTNPNFSSLSSSELRAMNSHVTKNILCPTLRLPQIKVTIDLNMFIFDSVEGKHCFFSGYYLGINVSVQEGHLLRGGTRLRNETEEQFRIEVYLQHFELFRNSKMYSIQSQSLISCVFLV